MLAAKPIAETGPVFRPDDAGSIVEAPRSEKAHGRVELRRRSPEKDNRLARHNVTDRQAFQFLDAHRRVGWVPAFAAYRRMIIFPRRIDQRDGPFSAASDELRQDGAYVFPP